VALLDTFIAIMAGLMIFPAAFSVGVQPDAGPSLIFITLPNVFQQAFGHLPIVGYVVGVLFYALLVFAAITSTISMHEIGTAFFCEEFHKARHLSAWVVTAFCSLLAIGCSLSLGAVDGIVLFGRSLMDFCDFLTAQVMLPLGAFLTSLFVGWFVDQRLLRDEFTNGGTVSVSFFRAYQFTVRFIVPLCILLIFLHQFGIV
jgi:NSS family neurotransmitter:Na+ symporter